MNLFPQELDSISRLCKLLDEYFQDEKNTIGISPLEIVSEDGNLLGSISTHGHESMTFQPLKD